MFMRRLSSTQTPTGTEGWSGSTHHSFQQKRPGHSVLRLQQTLGNQTVRRLLRDEALWAKCPITEPHRLCDGGTNCSNGDAVRTGASQRSNAAVSLYFQGDGRPKGGPSPDTAMAVARKPSAGISTQPPDIPGPEESAKTTPTVESSPRQSHVTTAPAWLVSSPEQWEATHFATLDVGVAIDVLDLAPDSSFNRSDEKYRWWNIVVLDGPAKGTVGWVMRTFLQEDRTQPRDVEVAKAVKRLAAAGKHWEAIDLVILEYGIDTRGAEFVYNPNLSVGGEANVDESPISIEIGPSAFASLAHLARVVLHEIDHVRQFQEGMRGDDLLEIGQFLSECVEMTATGVAELSFEEFMQAAEMASRFWYALGQTREGLVQQDKYWGTFVITRDVIRARYTEADPAKRTSGHENTLRWYEAQKNPGPPPLPR